MPLIRNSSEHQVKEERRVPRDSFGQGIDLQSSLEATSAGDLLKTLMRPPTKKTLDSILDSLDGDDNSPEREDDTEEEEEEEDPALRRLSRNLSQKVIPSRSPSTFPSDDEDDIDVDGFFNDDAGESKGGE